MDRKRQNLMYIDDLEGYGKKFNNKRLFMKKSFDAVKYQRKVREELSEKYASNREAFLKELRDKYGHLRKGKITS